VSPSNDIMEIREDKVTVEGKAWDSDECRTLVSKKTLQFKQRIDYWRYLIERGRKLMDAYGGKILSDEARAEYEDVLGKIIVEPRIMKPRIRALVGQQMKGRRSGQITTEGGTYDHPAASSAEIEIINMVLKDIELKTDEKYKIRDAIHDSQVACYPNVLFYEKNGPADGSGAGNIKLKHLPWDSCVFGPIKFQEPNGSDIHELDFFDWKSQAELEENFPDMTEQIRAHFNSTKKGDASRLSSVTEWEHGLSSEDRDVLFDIMQLATGSMQGPLGLTPVVMSLFPVIKKQEVWVNIFDESGEDYEIKPPDWSDARWEKWIEANKSKYHGPYERKVRILWMTVFTTSGLCLANEAHWYQNYAKLPASFWIPAMISGVPAGLGDDMYDDILATCVAEIEYLDELRKGSGKLFISREGSIANIEEAPEETAKAVGFLFLKKDANGGIEENIKEYTRSPNPAYKNYGEQRKANMDEVTRINETMQGEAAPRQAAIAKQTEIAQALIVNAIYIDNANRSYEYHQNLKLSIIPYCYTEETAITIQDEETQDIKQVEVNKVEQWDEEGNPVSIVNDLSSCDYKWKLAPVDDSSTAKQMQMQDAMVVLNAASGPLIKADPSGGFFAKFLAAMPNPLLNAAGRAMAKDAQVRIEQQSAAQQQEILQKAQVEMIKAQAEMKKAEKSGLQMQFTGEQLAQYPALQNFYLQLTQMFGNPNPKG